MKFSLATIFAFGLSLLPIQTEAYTKVQCAHYQLHFMFYFSQLFVGKEYTFFSSTFQISGLGTAQPYATSFCMMTVPVKSRYQDSSGA